MCLRPGGPALFFLNPVSQKVLQRKSGEDRRGVQDVANHDIAIPRLCTSGAESVSESINAAQKNAASPNGYRKPQRKGWKGDAAYFFTMLCSRGSVHSEANSFWL